MLPLALIAAAGAVFAAFKLTTGYDTARIAAALGLPRAYVQHAVKWSGRYGIPLDWILTTILVESNGNPRAAGDADGRSRGLMQVNVIAHARELTAAGLSAEHMYDPAKNIEWGTKYLREFRDNVLRALGGRPLPAALDEITRLAYKGPSTVLAALRRGENPLGISWAPPAIARWRNAMVRVRGAMGGVLTTARRVA
ncbi:MAG: hypothetical protein A2Y38_01425 [Spirochaetes bacterium GWB1_59_5]|nr:MAG: hypothetical protein A2Y38_01425 [Spirochaetes bacterium GWB1_59_5]